VNPVSFSPMRATTSLALWLAVGATRVARTSSKEVEACLVERQNWARQDPAGWQNVQQHPICQLGSEFAGAAATPPVDVPKKQREPLVMLTPDEFKEKVLESTKGDQEAESNSANANSNGANVGASSGPAGGGHTETNPSLNAGSEVGSGATPPLKAESLVSETDRVAEIKEVPQEGENAVRVEGEIEVEAQVQIGDKSKTQSHDQNQDQSQDLDSDQGQNQGQVQGQVQGQGLDSDQGHTKVTHSGTEDLSSDAPVHESSLGDEQLSGGLSEHVDASTDSSAAEESPASKSTSGKGQIGISATDDSAKDENTGQDYDTDKKEDTRTDTRESGEQASKAAAPKRIEFPEDELSESDSAAQAKHERLAKEALLAEHEEEQMMDATLKQVLRSQEFGFDEPEAHNEDEMEERFNYASLDAGAIIMNHNKAMKHSSALLVGDRDKYALSPCEEESMWVTIGLSEEIEPDIIELFNYERYSSTPRLFQVLGATSKNGRPVSEWDVLGEFEAEQGVSEQQFRIPEKAWVRYIRLRILSYWGSEFYCTLTEVRVYGSTDKFDAIHEDFDRMTDEVERMKESIDKALEKDEATPEADAVMAPAVDIPQNPGVAGTKQDSVNGHESTASKEDTQDNATQRLSPDSLATSSSQPHASGEAVLDADRASLDTGTVVPGENEGRSTPSTEASVGTELVSDTGDAEETFKSITGSPNTLVADTHFDGIVVTKVELLADAEKCEDRIARKHHMLPGVLCLRQKSSLQLAPSGSQKVVTALTLSQGCVAPFESVGFAPGTPKTELCVLTEVYEGNSTKVFETLNVESLPIESGTSHCIEMGSVALCSRKIADKDKQFLRERERTKEKEKEKGDQGTKRAAKNSLESIFKSLTDKVMTLEIDQSLLNKYMQNSTSTFKTFIDGIIEDQEGTEAALEELETSLKELKASTLSARESSKQQISAHTKEIQALKEQLEDLTIRHIALQNSFADILLICVMVLTIAVAIILFCTLRHLFQDRSQHVIYKWKYL